MSIFIGHIGELFCNYMDHIINRALMHHWMVLREFLQDTPVPFLGKNHGLLQIFHRAVSIKVDACCSHWNCWGHHLGCHHFTPHPDIVGYILCILYTLLIYLSMFVRYVWEFRTRVLKTRVTERAFWVNPFFQWYIYIRSIYFRGLNRETFFPD